MSEPKGDAKRRALGKGLDSLLPRIHAVTPPGAKGAPAAAQPAPQEVSLTKEIPVEAIEANPFQTRSIFNDVELQELANSIKANGVLQPILVRPKADGKYQLISGERRWRASKLAGKETIPAMMRQVSDEQALEITIIENLQRADLNPIEQARAFERLSREFHMTQEQMAFRTGKDRTSIGNFIRLLKLPDTLQLQVSHGVISIGHAKALLALPTQEMMLDAGQKVMALSLSVRQTEGYVSGLLDPASKLKQKEEKAAPPVDPNVREAEDRLRRALGLKVSIEDKGGKGRVVIEYGRLEDFDVLMERFS